MNNAPLHRIEARVFDAYGMLFVFAAATRRCKDELGVDRELGAPDVVIYNASARTRGPFAELVPAEVQRAMQITAFGAFLVAQ